MSRFDREKVLQLSLRAMSGDNCQPWTFTWEGDFLKISHQEELGRHYFNRKNGASIIAFGTLCELIAQASLLQGYEVSFQVLKGFGSENDPLWMEATFQPTDKTTTVTEDAILQRQSFRGVFEKKQALSADQIQQLKSLESNYSGLQVQFQSELSSELTEAYLQSDVATWYHHKAVADLIHWFRFTKKQWMTKKDGMYLPELGLSMKDAPGFWLLKHFPSLLRPMFHFAMKKMVRSILEKNFLSSSGVFFVAGNSVQNIDLWKAGRFSMRILLQLHQWGYCAQPLSSVSLVIADIERGCLPKDTEEPYKSIFLGLKSLIQKQMGFASNQIPIWAFRYGVISNVQSKVPQSLRRDLSFFWKKN